MMIFLVVDNVFTNSKAFVMISLISRSVSLSNVLINRIVCVLVYIHRMHVYERFFFVLCFENGFIMVES